MTKLACLNKANHFHDRAQRNRLFSEQLIASTNPPEAESKNDENDTMMFKRKLFCESNGRMCLSTTLSDREISGNVLLTKQARLTKTSYLNKRKQQSKLAFIVLISLLFVLFVCVNKFAYSLNCFHCSSADNPDCDETFATKDNYTGSTDCEKLIGRPAKVCRKIVQYIENKKVVIRSCGYIDEHEEKDRKSMCYKRSGTFALMMESCVCYEDLCNHSANLVPSHSVLTLLASIGFLTFYKLMSLNYGLH